MSRTTGSARASRPTCDEPGALRGAASRTPAEPLAAGSSPTPTSRPGEVIPAGYIQPVIPEAYSGGSAAGSAAIRLRTVRAFHISHAMGRMERKDDRQDHQGEVVLDERQVAEQVAGDGAEDHPGHAADDVVAHELAVAHGAQAGDERGEGADDRHESGEDDRLAAVLLVELVRVGQVLRLDQPEPLVGEESRPQEVPDPSSSPCRR